MTRLPSYPDRGSARGGHTDTLGCASATHSREVRNPSRESRYPFTLHPLRPAVHIAASPYRARTTMGVSIVRSLPRRNSSNLQSRFPTMPSLIAAVRGSLVPLDGGPVSSSHSILDYAMRSAACGKWRNRPSGAGGYQLACDARMRGRLPGCGEKMTLRQAFSLMAREPGLIRRYAYQRHESALTGMEAPIVLLRPSSDRLPAAIAKLLDRSASCCRTTPLHCDFAPRTVRGDDHAIRRLAASHRTRRPSTAFRHPLTALHDRDLPIASMIQWSGIGAR